MELILQIIVMGFLSIGALIALRKDYKKLTDVQKKQPIMLIFNLFPTIGLILLTVGIVIFENLLLGNIGIILFIIGIIFNVIRYSKSYSVLEKVRILAIALLGLVFYIFFYH